MFRALIILPLILFFFTSVSHSKGGACRILFNDPLGQPTYRFQKNEASGTLSQYVRDNHLDYSFFVRDYLKQVMSERPELYLTLRNLLNFKGWISGDNHSGNYIVAPVAGKMRYFFVDIKDGGYGPLFYNFANLVLNTHAVAKRADAAKIAEVADVLIEAYVDGLKKKKRDPPETIRDALETSLNKFGRMQDEDVQSFLDNSGRKFSLKKNNISEFETKSAKSKKIRSEMKKQIMDSGQVREVLDFVIRNKERGGSKDLNRIWALVEMNSGALRVVEFKEINIPAAQAVDKSGLSLKEHTEKMMSVYFPEADPLVKPVSLDGILYMMRPRKVDLYRVPYAQKSKSDLTELLELSSYAAYITGMKHAEHSPNTAQYLKLIETNPENFQLLLRGLVKDYYSRLDAKLSED